MAATTYPEYNQDRSSPFNIPNVSVPSAISPGQMTTEDIMNRQLGAAKDFRANMPQYQKSLYSNYEAGARNNLAKSIKGVQQDYNRRGLLRSGGRIGAEYGQRAQTEGDLASAKQGIASGLNDQASQLENQALTSAYTLAGSNPNLGAAATGGNQAALIQALGNMQAQQALYGGVASGFGQGLGYLAGSK